MNSNPNYEELKNALNKVSFMNINKRGGASSCNPNILYKYYKKYYSFIKREIELINPTTIVLMCGKQINEELSNVIENAKSIKMLHTAVRGKWLNVEKNIDEELKNVNDVEEPHLVFNRTTYKYMIKFIETLEERKKM